MRKISMHKIISIAPLMLIACGCTSIVEVDVSRSNAGSATSNDSATVMNTTATFYKIADHFQFVVDGPRPGPDYNSIYYDAGPLKTNSLYIDLTIDSNQITFMSHVLSGDLLSAQNAARLFEQGLDKQRITYHTTQRKDFLLP